MKESTALRLRVVGLPCLAILVGSIALYSAVALLLFRVLHFEEPRGDFWQFMVAALMPALPMYLWVLPRARRHYHFPQDMTPRLLLVFCGMLFGAAALMIAHETWEATTVTAHLQDANDPIEPWHADALTVANYTVDFAKVAGVSRRRVAHKKYGSDVELSHHLIAPMLGQGPASDARRPLWVAFSCSETVSSHLSGQEESARLQRLVARCTRSFMTRNYKRTSHFTIVHDGNDLDEFQRAAIKAGDMRPLHILFVTPAKPDAGELDGTAIAFGIAFGMFGVFMALVIASTARPRTVIDPPARGD